MKQLLTAGFALLLASNVYGQDQVTFSKVFTPNTIGPGSVSTITFTVTNGRTSPVTGLDFTDVLPTVPGNVDIATPANAATSCPLGVVDAPDGGGTISFSDGQLGAGQSCTVTVDVTAGTPGIHTNPAVTLDFNEAFEVGASSQPVDLTVDATLPGFSKSFAPNTIPLGDRSTLTFTIDNAANATPVLNLDFTDLLPTGMEIATPAQASTTCGTPTIPPTLIADAGTSIVTLDANGFQGFPALAAGASCTVVVDVIGTANGMLDNVTQDLLASFVSAGKASATLDVTATNIAIQKSFTDDPVPAGGTVTLEFIIDNFDRSFSATGVAFTDDLNAMGIAGLTFDSLLSNDCGGAVSGVGTDSITFTGGTLAPASFCAIQVSLLVPGTATPGSYANTTSTVTATVDGSPLVGNMASDTLFVSNAPVLTKEFLEFGTLNPDPVVNPGDDVVLRFTVSNTSTNSTATDITFIDELTDGSGGFPPDPTSGFLPFPVTVTLPPVPDPPCGAGSSLALISVGTDRQGLQLTGGSLDAAPGAASTCTFDVTVSIPADMPGGIYLNTTEAPSATVDGSNTMGKEASDDLTVVSAPKLSKAFTDDPVGPGGTVTLEFTLTYPADSSGNATDITFTDDLAPVLAGLIANLPPTPDPPCGAGSSLTASAGDTLLTLAGGTLAPAETCTFSVMLSVPAGAAPGEYNNTTSVVSATVAGVAATSLAASDDLSVAGLTFTKEFLSDPVIPGETTTLRFTIENIHPTDDATLTFFTDNLADVLPGTPDLTAVELPTVNTCGGTSSGTSFIIYQGGDVLNGQSCTIEYAINVPAGAPNGTFNNTTSGLSSSLGVIDPAVDKLTVNANLLSLLKAFTDDPVAPGDAVTLEFTLTNLDAARAASAIAFTDDLGAALTGMTFDSVLLDTCGGTVSGAGTGLITVSGAALAAAGSCTIQVSATVPAGTAANIYPNTTSGVTGTIDGLDVTGDSASDNLIVKQLLLFSKSFDGPTTATGSATLTFTITNPGVDIASGLDFTDDLNAVMAGLVATSLPAVPCGAGSSITGIGQLTFTGGELPPLGGTCSFDVEVLVPSNAAAGTFPNTTSVLFQSGLPVAEPATADLTIEPPPTFAKVFAPDVIFAGETSTLSFTIDNSVSALEANSLAFVDNMPAGLVVATPSVTANSCGGTLSADAGSSLISLTGGTVSAGATCTISVDVTGSITGALVNTTSDLTSSSGNSGTASDTLSINAAAGLSVTKSDGVTTAVPGNSVTYTIAVANAGPSTDPALTLVDNFTSPPLTCTYTSVASGGATGNTAAGSGNLAETLSMPANSTVIYTALCNIDSDATGTLSNTVTITPSIQDSTPGDNTATDDDTVLVPEADLSITKTDGVTSAVPGETTLVYSIVASNSGPSVDPSVSVTDTFPAELTCSYTSVAAGGATGNTAAGAGNLAETLSMPSGSSVTYSASCTIAADATGTLSNTATISGSVTDPDSSNNSATDDDTVLGGVADLSITKTDGVTSAVPGETTLVYSIVASNSGPSVDPSVSVTDTFPADLTCSYTSVAAGGATGNTAAGAGNLAETLSMPSGSSVTYSASCTIAADATGTLSNTATISGSVTDPDSSNNSATDDDTVLGGVADLSITKTDGVTSAVPGETTLVYSIVASNSGPSVDPSVSVTDTFPAELTCSYTSVAAGGATGNTAAGAGNLAETLSMPSGSSVTYSASCTIAADATGTLSNTATISGSVTDPDSSNNSATDDDTVLGGVADLAITKTDGVTSAVPGETTLVYSIVASNSGPSVDPSVSVTDTFPAELTCSYTSVAAGGATGNTAAGAGNLAETLSMPSGSSVTYSASCTIAADATGTLSNTATISGSVTDPDSSNNSATDDDTLLIPAPVAPTLVPIPTLSEWMLMLMMILIGGIGVLYLRPAQS